MINNVSFYRSYTAPPVKFSANEDSKPYQEELLLPSLSYTEYKALRSLKLQTEINTIDKTIGLEAYKAQQIKSLEPYINLIKDKKYKDLVLAVYQEAPMELFTQPSSTSGKFHHEDELGLGGTVLHFKRVAVMGEQSARRFYETIENYEERQKLTDMALTAVLLHDAPYRFGQKKITDFSGKKILAYYTDNQGHAVNNAIAVEKKMKDINEQTPGNFSNDEINKICSGIGFHLGIWQDWGDGNIKNPKYPLDEESKKRNSEWLKLHKQYKDDPIVKIVQEADYHATIPFARIDPEKALKLIKNGHAH